jgi:nicotinamidase-related amidase
LTTLENRPNSALLVVDVQNCVVEGAHEREAVVANIDSLVDRARRKNVPVVWVQHSDEDIIRGSDDWQIVPELTPADGEPRVDENYGDSFEATALENVLSGLEVGRLVVAGAETDACIRSTVHGAFVRGYDVTLVSDTRQATRRSGARRRRARSLRIPTCTGATSRRRAGPPPRSRPETSRSEPSTLGVRVLKCQVHSDLAARRGGGL